MVQIAAVFLDLSIPVTLKMKLPRDGWKQDPGEIRTEVTLVQRSIQVGSRIQQHSRDCSAAA
jgi:hypothetical protein